MKTWRWHVVRIELAAGFVSMALVAFVVLTEPHTMGGGPRLIEHPHVWLGIAGIAVGLLRMLRVYRGDPEAGPSSWRATRDR